MIEILLLGMVIGALLAIAAAVARTTPANDASRSCVLLFVTSAGYAAYSSPHLFDLLGPLKPVVWLLGAGGSGYFWMFGMALFGRERLRAVHAVPPALLTLIAVAAILLPAPTGEGADMVHNMLTIVLIGHVIIEIWLGRGDDLVAGRLALRLPFMLLLAAVELAFAGFSVARLMGGQVPWMEELRAAILAGVTIAGVLTFIEARSELFVSPSARRGLLAGDLVALSASDRQLMERLEALIEDGDFWRRNGLGIAATAEEVGAPEYRVRQLINRHLGYRNFSDFLNERRIAMAKEELRDPAKALVQISTIAFDLGYASLGPFNRAFRDATGMTPREWREAPVTASEA